MEALHNDSTKQAKKAILSSFSVYWGSLLIEKFEYSFHTNRNQETRNATIAIVVEYIKSREVRSNQPISRYTIIESHTKSITSDKLFATDRYNYLGEGIAL